jgi:hypothetical protein
MRFTPLSFLLSALSLVVADVSFTNPAAGSSFAVGTIQVEWEDSGTAPALSELTTYSLFLCAGGSDETSIIQLTDITTNGNFANGNLAEGTLTEGLGASTPKNA